MKTGEFISELFEIRDNAHIAHLQTDSYAQHKALNQIYDGIVELADRFAESYQGCYEVINEYSQIKIEENLDFVIYLKEKLVKIKKYRETLDESHLQQIIDDIIELIDSTIYKLKFLD